MELDSEGILFVFVFGMRHMIERYFLPVVLTCSWVYYGRVVP